MLDRLRTVRGVRDMAKVVVIVENLMWSLGKSEAIAGVGGFRWEKCECVLPSVHLVMSVWQGGCVLTLYECVCVTMYVYVYPVGPSVCACIKSSSAAPC